MIRVTPITLLLVGMFNDRVTAHYFVQARARIGVATRFMVRAAVMIVVTIMAACN